MSIFKKAATLTLQLGAGVLICSSCDNLASDCDYLKSCPQGGAGGAGAPAGGNSGGSSLGGGGTAGGSGGKSTAGAGGSGASGDNGGGAGEAGTAGNGGAEAGGSAGEAGSAGSGGAGGALPCDGACVDPTPHCDPLSNLCVECLAKPDCASPKPVCDSATHTCVECATRTDCKAAGAPACNTETHRCVACLEQTDCTGTTPLCDSTTHTCVACLEQTDCAEPTASRCDLADHACKPCTLDAHCSDIAGKEVCLAGTCVECTATKAAACGSNLGTPLVCDSLKHTCTTLPARSAGLCQPCVADAQCALGELCVLDTLGSGATQKTVGYFCHWKQGDIANGAPADCPTKGRPYVRVVTDAMSIDGETADICVLRTSSCPASNEFGVKDCAPSGTPDETLCGVSPPDDAKCVQYGAGFLCTMTCLSDYDCPSPSTCNTNVTPRVCTLL